MITWWQYWINIAGTGTARSCRRCHAAVVVAAAVATVVAVAVVVIEPV